MREMMEEWKLNLILTAVLGIVGGIVLFVWPDVTVRIVCRLIGVILAVMAVIQVVNFFSAPSGTLIRQWNLLLAVIFAAVGAWILIRPDSVISLIPIIMGVLLVFHGLYDLQQAIFLGKARYSFWGLVLLFALVTVALGVLLIWNPFEAVSLAVKVIGLALAFDGASDLWILSRARRVTRLIREAAAEEMEL